MPAGLYSRIDLQPDSMLKHYASTVAPSLLPHLTTDTAGMPQGKGSHVRHDRPMREEMRVRRPWRDLPGGYGAH